MTWDIKAGLMGKCTSHARASPCLLPTDLIHRPTDLRPRPSQSRGSSPSALPLPDIPLTIDDYLARRTAEQDARWPHVQLLPGVARLVAHLAAHGIPISIATGSMRRSFHRKTAHLQHAFVHFGSNVVCGDDAAGRGKPFPDRLLAAARMLGRAVRPNEEGGIVAEAEREERAHRLVFEDAVPGVQAGKRAGMSVVWVPDENLLSIQPSLDIEKPD
ncbi:HAD-like domain-containing protein [Russula earlei]|uniref:HAD-like domain-containing protein n=1 Tax=Russula earlei TaxID=71964 RepID=A0ACC0U1F2_9AGAM|nr:HAD-like domain-containing protein [Russula earlei]